MGISPEEFAALARSSPWRWTTLRFTLSRGDVRYPDQLIRAWVRRPDALRVESAAGEVLATSLDGAGSGVGVPLAPSAFAGMPTWVPVTSLGDDTMTPPSGMPLRYAGAVGPASWVGIPMPDTAPVPGRPVPGRDRDSMLAFDASEPQARGRLGEPTFRPDGLVAARPEGETLGDLDAPFYENYYWIALLDPKELADGYSRDSGGLRPGVVIRDVTEVDHHGRPALQAFLTPTAAYDPRCGCCSLLRSRATDIEEWGAGHDAILAEYPSAYRARLDRGTGVCVLLEAQGGSVAGTGHEVVIEAVDEPLADTLFAAA